MADDSLYDAIRKGGYDASLFTTFNAYFPFYEEVVLRRLRASECRHNVVLADAGQCTASLADAFSAPRRAGAEYTLIPMRSKGAFHPKILLLVAKTKGLLYVGSHNLTLAGFGYNRELTNAVAFNAKDSAGVGLARAAWNSIKAWLGEQAALLPRATVEAALSLRNHAPWLEGGSTDQTSPVFLARSASSAPLLNQIAAQVPKAIKSIIVVGAFFDTKLLLLKELRTRWPNAQLICGVEPETVSLPGKRTARSEFDFRDATQLGCGSGYLHAKAIFFEAKTGEHLLVSGSPNPSAPAWLGENAEAIILRTGSEARKVAEELGLLSIKDLKPLENDQWAAVSTDLSSTEQAGDSCTVIVACESESGFEVLRAALPAQPTRCIAVCDDGALIELARPEADSRDTLIVRADSEIRRTCQCLLFEFKGRDRVRAIVHHTAMIEDLARSTKQAQLRVALQGLSSGTADIAKLVTAVERVIFDDAQASTAEISGRSRGETASSTEEVEANVKPETLAVAIEQTKRARRHRRLLRSTDLGYLLDVLIHRLGVGLSSSEPSIDSRGRSEEDQIDQDDDDSPETAKNVDDVALAALCRRKLRKLTTRMKAQMEKASKEADLAPTVLVQLVAVLAVLRELRVIEKHERWRRAHECLVDEEDEHDLLENVMISFFGRGLELYAKVVTALGTDRFDEIARLKGLLTWLAWDCGVILDSRFGIAELREDVEERLWNRAALLELIQILSGDEISLQEAKSSILAVAAPGIHQSAVRWIDDYEAWSMQVERARQRMTSHDGSSAAPTLIGGLAFATAASSARLRVVASVSETAVTLFDFNEDIHFRRDRVASAD